MRGDDGVLVRGKFVPIRSGHLPPQRRAHGIYGMPAPGSGQEQMTMTGALTDDQPARVSRVGNRNEDSTRGRNGQTEQGATLLEKKKKTKREERMNKLLKTVSWFLFCCGLCERWDLAADSHPDGVQNVVVRGGERGRLGRLVCI